MKSIGGRTIADDLGIEWGSTANGPFHLLKDDHGSSLAKH
jgi:hypothetical protein